MRIDLERYRVKAGTKRPLKHIHTDEDGGWEKDEAIARLGELRLELDRLQELLYADGRRGLVLVLQGMDTSGKDSTIREVFEGVNPQGVRVVSFKAPSTTELAHDYLWRIHQNTPARGTMTVFNRSQYEDVLIVRVKDLAPRKIWEKRYGHINDFERMLTDEGTAVVKCFLHISKNYQKKRLEKRLADPAKHWKFDPNDLVERKHWDLYQVAYEEMLRRCSTAHAPWHIIPAENRWYRDILVAQLLAQTLRDMDLRYPKAKFDPRLIKID